MYALKALAVAPVLLFVVGGNVANAQNEQALIDELIRKAERREAENSFCSRVTWPNGDSVEGFTTHLRNASVGSWKVSTFSSGTCSLDRVTEVFDPGTGKCVTYKTWVCHRATGCDVLLTVDCLDKNGVFITRNGKRGG